MAVLFAATYPARTIGLILYGTVADYTAREPSDPFVDDAARYETYIDANWGTLDHARNEIRTWAAPGHEDDERLVTWLASYLRRSASPGAAIALSRMNRAINAGPALSAIHVPTLVMAKTGDLDFAIEQVRAEADRIAGARLVEFPGNEHFFWVGEYDGMLDEIERFTGGLGAEEAQLQRSLATVLFTDIVGSTEKGAELGDRGWKELVEAHHARVRGQLARYQGTEVDTAGDGFFATFDGPARAVRCACSIGTSVRSLGIEVRAGVHTGEVEMIDGKVGGLAVVIGARVGAKAGPSEVLVSQTVKDLTAGSGLVYQEAGEHELKGVPDRWRLYRVVTA